MKRVELFKFLYPVFLFLVIALVLTIMVPNVGAADTSAPDAVCGVRCAASQQQPGPAFDIVTDCHGDGFADPNFSSTTAGSEVSFTVYAKAGRQVASVNVITADGNLVMLSSLGGGIYSFTMPGSSVVIDVCYQYMQAV